jgi:hypothetical protein
MGLSPELRRTGRHAGYAIAVVVNLATLIIALNILEWGWLPFLTGEFNTVLPWISLSLLATIVANLVYQLNDTPGVRATGQIGVNLISLFVTFQIWQVFPFDFSAYGFDWGAVARILLIVAMVGAGIGVLTEALRLASAEPDRERR